MQIIIESYDHPDILLATAELLKTMANIKPDLSPKIEFDEAPTTGNTIKEAEAPTTNEGVVPTTNEGVVPTTKPPTEAPVATEPPAEEPLLDAAGLPWDERINSAGNVRLNKDGTWKRRRGVSVEEYDNVRKQLATGEPDIAAQFSQPIDMAWPDFVNKCVVARNEGQYDDSKAAEFLAENKVDTFKNLIGRPDLWTKLLDLQGIDYA